MKILDFMNKRAKRLSIIDWKLAQASAMCIALVLAKLVPNLLDLSIWWFVIIGLICYIKPLYTFYLDDNRWVVKLDRRPL